MGKYAKEAQEIIDAVGGVGNISAATNWRTSASNPRSTCSPR